MQNFFGPDENFMTSLVFHPETDGQELEADVGLE